MNRFAVIALAIAAVSAPASASGPKGDVWHQAVGDSAALNDEAYRFQLEAGDEIIKQATAKGMTAGSIESLVDKAIMAYRTAAEAKPEAAEPYWRIGETLYAFYFEQCLLFDASGIPLEQRSKLCPGPDPSLLVRRAAYRARGVDMLDAWAAFEKRAPLDPRITESFLFERAIIETKMATHESWLAATHDYEAILARDDRHSPGNSANTAEGNLAETYMMLGRLDDAIPMYQRAVNDGIKDAFYGYVVALDRDDQTDRAENLIADAGEADYDAFRKQVRDGYWFFVPTGEQYYYFALAEEAFGEPDKARADWQHFLDSGAHPQYQARARAHLAAPPRPPRRTPSPDPPDFDE